MAVYRWTFHQRRRVPNAADVKVWLIQEDTLGTFKQPTSSDVIKVNETVAIAQLAERIASAGLETGNRDPAETFLGRFDHFELPLVIEPRPPLALSGTSVPQEDPLLLGLYGSRKFTNDQGIEDITAVISHSRTSTVIEIADTLSDWSTRPNVLRYVSNNTDSAENETGLFEVTAATEPVSGTVRLTLEPGLPVFPTLTGTADQVQGVTVYYSDDDLRWEDTGHSLLVKRGFQTFGASGGHVPSVERTRGARGLMVETYQYHGERIAWRGADDQIFGNGTDDTLTTTGLTVKVGNAKKQTANGLGIIKRYRVSDGVLLGTEGATTPVKIDSLNKTTNVLTLANRGDNPQSAGNLQVQTTVAQERAGTYDLTNDGKDLRIQFGGREFVTIDLLLPTAPVDPANATAAEVAVNINATLKISRFYGQHHAGHGGETIAWDEVATVAVDRVHLEAPTFGSESQIATEDTGTATSAHAIVFDSVFDISADDELQWEPWNPGGTVTLNPITEKFGMPTMDGHQLRGSEYTFALSQAIAWIEDVVNLDGFPDGSTAGPRREVTAATTVPGFGWTDELDTLAEDDTEVRVHLTIGKVLGGAYSTIMGAAQIGVPEPGGDNVAQKTVAISPATPTGSKAVIQAVG